jgi:hypothetical protein
MVVAGAGFVLGAAIARWRPPEVDVVSAHPIRLT